MGADLITSTLWYRLGQMVTLTHPAGFTYTRAEPLLDWTAGREKATTLVGTWDADTLEAFTDQSFGFDPTDPAANRANALDTILQELDALQEDIETGGRDIDGRTLNGVAFVITGGMSWGDGPTEAFDRWSRWDNEDAETGIPGGQEILAAVGFISDPERCIGVVQPPHHTFTSTDGLYCDTCALPRENQRHGSERIGPDRY